jgi:hypothetical protein
MAQTLGKPVRLWVSDKQDAFVKGIAAEFPGVPHRYCSNHFLRDLAKPTLEADSHAKVQMRKKVRGLRDIERQVLRSQKAGPQALAPGPGAAQPGGAAGAARAAGVPPARDASGAAQVVLDYCGTVRGILNDDQGGPLHPPGLRMAEALQEVRASLGRVLALDKPGPAHGQLARLAGCIDRGLATSREDREQVRAQAEVVAAVAGTLAAEGRTLAARRAEYGRLARQCQAKGGGFHGRLAKVMQAWQAGLFVGVRGKGGPDAPWDNLELERWFRLPKGHERRIHGRRHAGARIGAGGGDAAADARRPQKPPGAVHRAGLAALPPR